MRHTPLFQSSFKKLTLATLVSLASTTAVAQNLNVNNDAVTITSGGGFNQMRTIPPTTGIIPSVDIPVTGISGGAATPNFSFTFESTSVADGSYDFSAAFIIDDDNSARRLEIMIPTITMAVSGTGTALTGTVAAGSTVTVRGRAADNTTELSASLSNALFNFNGATLSFDSGAQVTEIASKGGILGDIATTIAATGGYTYAVVLKQKSGTLLTLGTELTGFKQFGCAPAGTFVLGSNAFNSMDGGYGVQGQFQVGGGALGAAPSVFPSTGCTNNISAGGGGGGGSTTTPEGQTSAVSDATSDLATTVNSGPVTAETVTAISTLATDSQTAATSVAAGLADNSVSVATGISLLTSMASQVDILRNAYDKAQTAGDTENRDAITAIGAPLLRATSTLSKSLKGRTFTPTEVAELQTVASTFTSSLANYIARLLTQLIPSTSSITVAAITESTAIEDLGSLVESYRSIIADFAAVSGFQINSTVFSNSQNISQSVSEGVIAPLGTLLGLSISYTNDAAAHTLLSGNTTLLSRLIEIVGINFGSEIEISRTATEAALVAEGVSGSFVSAIATDIAQFVKADDLNLDTGSGSTSVSSRLMTALGADTLTVNSTTGAINYSNGGSNSVAFLKSIMPAPAVLPTGTFVLSDGSSAIIADGLVFIVVSGSNSITDFAGAIHSVGAGSFSTSITDAGVIKLTETASGAIFSSTMSTSALATATATSTTTFEAPSGDPADSSYRFVVQYDDGSRQEILPAISDPAFFTSVGNAGFQVTTDRRTGIVNIGGFNFRPDFFQVPLTASDTTYHTANADASGVAYRAVDANGDGRTDYQVLTATGVQTVYGQP